MNAISYVDVFEIESRDEQQDQISVGDLVRTGPNLHPHFAVLAVHGDKAWLRNVQSGQDALTLLARCKKVAAD